MEAERPAVAPTGGFVPQLARTNLENPWYLLGISSAIAIGGLLLAFAMYGRNPRQGEERLRKMLDRSTPSSKRNGTWTNCGLAGHQHHVPRGQICNWIDLNIRPLVHRRDRQERVLRGRLLREEQSGKLQQYAMMMVVAVCVIIVGIGVPSRALYSVR